VELAAIIAALLITIGSLVALAGIGLHAWMTGHENRLKVTARWAGAWAGRLGLRRQARTAGGARFGRRMTAGPCLVLPPSVMLHHPGQVEAQPSSTPVHLAQG
jgi:hypothetical protein